MGRSLRSLEQSLAKPKAAAAKKTGSKGNRRSQPRKVKKVEGFTASLATQQLAPAQLQEQIDVIRGRKIAQPTRSLRALEDRVLGRKPARTAPQRETLRIDKGQVAPPPAAPIQPASAPSVSALLPQPGNTVAAASLWPQPKQQRLPAQPYAPEFSAPGTGRFQVESFAAGPTSPEDLFKPDAAVGAPAISAAPSVSAPAFAPTSAEPGISLPVNDDAIGWLAQAQSEQPKKITTASRKSLDSGLSLAKDEFERELASILGQPGTAAAPVVAPPAPDPLFQNAQPQNTQAQPAPQPTKPPVPDPNAPPPHPSHDVFDQMGLGMRYANSFDLGNVNLNDRFNRFEQELEQPAAPQQRAPAPTAASPFVDPYANPMSLDEFDLVAELAEIGAEKPACPPAQSNNPNSTDTTAGEHHEQPIG